MNREIRFRGLGKNMIWRYGYYHVVNEAIQSYHYIREASSDHRIFKPESVGQFTGLKDKNGVDIYEGDVLEMDGVFTYAVRFEDGKFVAHHINSHAVKGTKWGDLHRFFDPDFKDTYTQVIGNIYQHPHLLK